MKLEEGNYDFETIFDGNDESSPRQSVGWSSEGGDNHLANYHPVSFDFLHPGVPVPTGLFRSSSTRHPSSDADTSDQESVAEWTEPSVATEVSYSAILPSVSAVRHSKWLLYPDKWC